MMMGKFICGMTAGLVVGSMVGIAAKCMMEQNEKNQIKRKAKKLLRKVENYVSDTMPFMD